MNRSDLLVNSGLLATDLKMVGFWVSSEMVLKSKPCLMRETQRYLCNFSRFHFFLNRNRDMDFLIKRESNMTVCIKMDFMMMPSDAPMDFGYQVFFTSS